MIDIHRHTKMVVKSVTIQDNMIRHPETFTKLCKKLKINHLKATDIKEVCLAK